VLMHADLKLNDVSRQGIRGITAEQLPCTGDADQLSAGSGIAVDGKSFHDPLVPTGPGVREPQNRRAVIDMGG